MKEKIPLTPPPLCSRFVQSLAYDGRSTKSIILWMLCVMLLRMQLFIDITFR